jgi:hypothetical protein
MMMVIVSFGVAAVLPPNIGSEGIRISTLIVKSSLIPRAAVSELKQHFEANLEFNTGVFIREAQIYSNRIR